MGAAARAQRTSSTPRSRRLSCTVAEDELIQPEPTIVLDQVSCRQAARAQYDRMQRQLIAGAGEAQ